MIESNQCVGGIAAQLGQARSEPVRDKLRSGKICFDAIRPAQMVGTLKIFGRAGCGFIPCESAAISVTLARGVAKSNQSADRPFSTIEFGMERKNVTFG